MRNFKILLMVMVFFTVQNVNAENNSSNTTNTTTTVNTCTEPETDDSLNSDLLNTLPAVNILNLSGKDCDGRVIDCFVIHTLPNAETGTLYLADAQTEVLVGQYLNLEQSDGLRFNPSENFEGTATFTYCSVDDNDIVDSTPATGTLPIVAPTVNGDISTNNGECNTSVSPVVHGANCTCKDYETSIPTFSIFSYFLIFMLTLLIVGLSVKKEI